MKTSITISAIFFCIQLAFAGTPAITPTPTPTIKPQLDTFPKEPTFGLTAGFLSKGNLRLLKAYQIGVFSEFRTTSFFATELELSTEYKRVNFEDFGQGRRGEVNLNFAVNSKIYFGKEKDLFYMKLGFFANGQIWNDGGDLFSAGNIDRDFTTGIQLGVGHIWDLGPNTSKRLRFEPIISWDSDLEFSAGFKIGYLF